MLDTLASRYSYDLEYVGSCNWRWSVVAPPAHLVPPRRGRRGGKACSFKDHEAAVFRLRSTPVPLPAALRHEPPERSFLA